MFDGVYKRFIESDEEIRALRLDQTQLCDSFLQVLQHAVHQSSGRWEAQTRSFREREKEAWVVDVAQFVRKGLLDYFAQLVAVVRQFAPGGNWPRPF